MSPESNAMPHARAAAQPPPKRVKLLTGAPDAARLCWDEEELLNDWTPVFRRFLERQFTADAERSQHQPATSTGSRWRSVPESRGAHLRTGFTQESPVRRDFLYAPTFANDEHDRSFAHTSSQASTVEDGQRAVQSDEEDPEDQFIEHSIVIHDDLRSSQLALDPLEESTILEHSFHTDSSFNSLSEFVSGVWDDDDDDDDDPSEHQLETKDLPRYITSLRDIPSAAHLKSIVPQTVVVNVIAGVISILPVRCIRTRHGTMRDLLELLVGDETAVGLKISFWFPHQDSQNQDSGGKPATSSGIDPLRDALQSLQVQDVVLVENVALDIFKDKVFGYSLRKSMQKNQTRVELLARNGANKVAGLRGVEKVENVKNWVFRLVNPGADLAEVGKKNEHGEENVYLPPDTPE